MLHIVAAVAFKMRFSVCVNSRPEPVFAAPVVVGMWVAVRRPSDASLTLAITKLLSFLGMMQSPLSKRWSKFSLPHVPHVHSQ